MAHSLYHTRRINEYDNEFRRKCCATSRARRSASCSATASRACARPSTPRSPTRRTRTEFRSVLTLVEQNRAPIDELTLIEAHLDDGQILHALNEIFIGHRSHQSARYRLRIEEREERQSSSGIIVATGTGATGWARSISRERNLQLDLDARSHRLAVLVREAFPAPGSGMQLTSALVDGGVVAVTSEMGDGGFIFGDGIESDFLRFG